MMPLEPFPGGLFQNLGRGLVQAHGRHFDVPDDIRIHRRQKLSFVAVATRWDGNSAKIGIGPVSADCGT
jgi:hypothetical protein